jgi:hypothetical protein
MVGAFDSRLRELGVLDRTEHAWQCHEGTHLRQWGVTDDEFVETVTSACRQGALADVSEAT